MTRYRAEYECLSCRHRWEWPAGPVLCPICGNSYVRWLNFYTLTGQTIVDYARPNLDTPL